MALKRMLGMGVVIHSHSYIQKGPAFIRSFDGPIQAPFTPSMVRTLHIVDSSCCCSKLMLSDAPNMDRTKQGNSGICTFVRRMSPSQNYATTIQAATSFDFGPFRCFSITPVQRSSNDILFNTAGRPCILQDFSHLAFPLYSLQSLVQESRQPVLGDISSETQRVHEKAIQGKQARSMSAMSFGMNLGTTQAKLRMLSEDVSHREMKNLLHSSDIHVCGDPQFGRFNDTIRVSLNCISPPFCLFKPRGTNLVLPGSSTSAATVLFAALWFFFDSYECRWMGVFSHTAGCVDAQHYLRSFQEQKPTNQTTHQPTICSQGLPVVNALPRVEKAPVPVDVKWQSNVPQRNDWWIQHTQSRSNSKSPHARLIAGQHDARCTEAQMSSLAECALDAMPSLFPFTRRFNWSTSISCWSFQFNRCSPGHQATIAFCPHWSRTPSWCRSCCWICSMEPQDILDKMVTVQTGMISLASFAGGVSMLSPHPWNLSGRIPRHRRWRSRQASVGEAAPRLRRCIFRSLSCWCFFIMHWWIS